MRRFLSRAAVGCAALVVGVVIGSIHQHLLEKRLAVSVAPPSPVQTAPPAAIPASPAEDVYPENESLYPTAIEYYIESHPHADLTRLAERLNIRWQNYYDKDALGFGLEIANDFCLVFTAEQVLTILPDLSREFGPFGAGFAPCDC